YYAHLSDLSVIFTVSLLFFSLSHAPHHRDLHSFPTRRSSDLLLLEKYNRAQAVPELKKALAINPQAAQVHAALAVAALQDHSLADRKSTRLNSSHGSISYAVFCLKKKKKIQKQQTATTHTKDD